MTLSTLVPFRFDRRLEEIRAALRAAFRLAVLAWVVSGCAASPKDGAASIGKVSFARTLVVGASVSAADDDSSPGKRLLRTQGTLANAWIYAKGGTPGTALLETMPAQLFDQATAIIAVDLFFWDSTASNCGPVVRTIDELFIKTRARALPVIIGNIPDLYPAQPCRDTINAHLTAVCGATADCYLLDLSAIHERLRREGLWIEGQTYDEGEVLPDGLHPTPLGAEYIADEIRRLVAARSAP